MSTTDVRRSYGVGRDGQQRVSVTEVLQSLGWGTDGLMNFAGWAAADRMAELVASGMAPGPAKWAACKAHEEVRATKAEIGTIAHALVEAHLRGETYEVSPFVPAEMVEAARTAARKFIAWWPTAGLTAEHIEHKMVDDAYDIGGTADLVAKDGAGRRWVCDLKTGSTVHESAVIQLGAYASLLKREGIHVDGGLIIHSPVKDELTVRVISAESLALGAMTFVLVTQVHRVRAQFKKAIRLNRKHFDKEIKGAA